MKLNKVVSTLGMEQETWLQYRKNGIGGSDAGAICGLNPYSTAMTVYLDKLGKTEETPDNEAMRQGRDFEQYVAERFMEDTGKKVRRANAIFSSGEHPFMYANVDRLIVGEDAGLECKTANAYNADKWKDGHIPEHYEIQCHHYMAVTGAKAWYIACVVLGKGFIWKKIERDEELIADLVQIEKDFWEEHVKKEVPPDPDGSKAADEVIAQYYNTADEGKTISLNGFDKKLERREEINALMDKLETEKKQIEQEIKVEMEDAEAATANDYKIIWKNSSANRVDTKLLKEEYPDIYKDVLKCTSSRRFLIKRV